MVSALPDDILGSPQQILGPHDNALAQILALGTPEQSGLSGSHQGKPPTGWQLKRKSGTCQFLHSPAPPVIHKASPRHLPTSSASSPPRPGSLGTRSTIFRQKEGPNDRVADHGNDLPFPIPSLNLQPESQAPRLARVAAQSAAPAVAVPSSYLLYISYGHGQNSFCKTQ